MADNKHANEDGKKDDSRKAAPKKKDFKRCDSAFTCSNEECKKRNNGVAYDYFSYTYSPEYQRRCPKCGTMNERHSSGTCLVD